MAIESKESNWMRTTIVRSGPQFLFSAFLSLSLPYLRSLPELENISVDDPKSMILDKNSFKIVQQPKNDSGFVSPKTDSVTEYGPAKEVGNMVFMAHTHLAGKYFQNVQGDKITIDYETEKNDFIVEKVLRFQKVPYVGWEDLDTGKTIGNNSLFDMMYLGESPLVLQTCIEKDDDPNWGLKFIVAGKITNPTKDSALFF